MKTMNIQVPAWDNRRENVQSVLGDCKKENVGKNRLQIVVKEKNAVHERNQ